MAFTPQGLREREKEKQHSGIFTILHKKQTEGPDQHVAYFPPVLYCTVVLSTPQLHRTVLDASKCHKSVSSWKKTCSVPLVLALV